MRDENNFNDIGKNNNDVHDELCHVVEEETTIDREQEIKRRQDTFLDAYAYYLNNKTPIQKCIVQRKAMDLELIDPSFNFTID